MKKRILLFLCSLLFILPAVIIFSACGKDEGIFLYVDCAYNNAQGDNVNEIVLQYGEKHTLTKNDFTITEHFDNGSTKVGKITTFTSTIPDDQITPVGEYSVSIEVVKNEMYFYFSYIVEVAYIAKVPTLLKTCYTYTGYLPTLEFDSNFNPDYMYILDGGSSPEIGYHHVALVLEPYCYWEDGTNDWKYYDYRIIGEEVPKPALVNDVIEYSGQNFSDLSTLFDSNFNSSIMTIYSNDSLTEPKDYTLTVSITDYDFCFEGGETSFDVQLTINPAVVNVNELPISEVKEFTFNNNQAYRIVDEDALADISYIFVYNNHYEHAGEYETIISFDGYADFCEWDYKTPIDGVEIKNGNVHVFWKINSKVVQKPEMQSEFVFNNYDLYRPLDMEYNNEGFSLSGDYEGAGAGEYTIILVLDNIYAPKDYVWDDGSYDDYAFDWKIDKAQLSEWQYPEPLEVKAKNTFTVDDINLPFGWEFSTYSSEDKMPITGVSWQEAETEGLTGGTLTKYTYTDSDGIIWVKNVYDYIDDSKDKTEIIQTFDLSDKNIDDEQKYYITYLSIDNNYYDKDSIPAKIRIKEKGSQFLDYMIDSDYANTYYGDFVKVSYFDLRGVENPTITYSYHTYLSQEIYSYTHDEENPEPVKAGTDYALYISVSGSEDYEELNCLVSYGVNISKMRISSSHLEGRVSASKVYLFESLNTSTLSGTALVKGREVQGTFTWATPSVEPTKEDSLTTNYNFTFTPNDQENYIGTNSSIVVEVDKARAINYTFPKIGNYEGGSYFREGDRYDSLFINSSNAYVYDKKNNKIKGTWSVLNPEGLELVGNDFAIKFTPDDQDKYYGLEFDSLFGKLESFFRVDDIVVYNQYKPEFIVHKNGEINYHLGSAVVLYTNGIDSDPASGLLDFSSDKIEITDVDGRYSVSYLGYTSSNTYDYTECLTISDSEEFYMLIQNNPDSLDLENLLVLVDGNITVEKSIGSINYVETGIRIVVPSWSSLSLNDISLNQDGPSEDIKLATTKTQIHTLSSTFYNFGELYFERVHNNLELINYGETNIKYCYLNYLYLYNDEDGVVSIEERKEFEAEAGNDEPTYRMYGSFENYGAFNFIYHREEATIFNVTEEEYNNMNYANFNKFIITADSINKGSIIGSFIIRDPAKVSLLSGSSLNPDVGISIRTTTASGNKSQMLMLNTFDRETTTPTSEFTYEVRNIDDFENCLKLFNKYEYDSIYLKMIIYEDIDITGYEDRFWTGTGSSTGKASILISRTCSIKVESYASLNLSTITMAIEWDSSNKGYLYNYGMVTGTVVYDYNKIKTESCGPDDYILSPRAINGNVYSHEQYKDLPKD